MDLSPLDFQTNRGGVQKLEVYLVAQNLVTLLLRKGRVVHKESPLIFGTLRVHA